MVQRLAFLALLLILSACVTAKGSFCDNAHPIRLPAKVIDQLTEAQLQEYVAYMRKGVKFCGWKP